MAALGARVRASLGPNLHDDADSQNRDRSRHAAAAGSWRAAEQPKGHVDLKGRDLRGSRDAKGPHMDQLASDMRDIDRELEELEARLGVAGR